MATKDTPNAQLADAANVNVNRLNPPLYPPNDHPDAQWFPRAGLGLFMHWGIHSVAAAQPSWCMLDRCPFGGPRIPPADYYALADRFDPQHYDPDKWLAAARRAGFTYAVLTAKHHDGYTLWPSESACYGTHSHMAGRDLLEPYVQACRANGLKVGLYFSQRDWSYPEFPMGDPAFDYPTHKQRAGGDQAAFDRFFDFTMSQIRELLTRYGKIDVLWFDSCDWPGVDDRHLQARHEIRQLMPGIVMNERWGEGNTGDFSTWECKLPPERPAGWWEACAIWDGHWGYNRGGPAHSAGWVLDTLTSMRGWGGNFLLNMGPAPDGTMKPAFYRRCDELGEWMAVNGESVTNVDGLPIGCSATHAVTVGKNAWYVHIPCDKWPLKPVRITNVPARPVAVLSMRSGCELRFDWAGNTISIAPDNTFCTALMPTCQVDVIKLVMA